jgi:hypothetical protein
MSAARILTAIAIGRLVIGVAMILLPEQVGRRWLGRGAATAESAAFVRAIGGRDVAYALGSLQAARAGDPKPWLAAGLLVDGTDAYATVRAEGVSSGQKLIGGWAAFVAVAANAAALFADDEA